MKVQGSNAPVTVPTEISVSDDCELSSKCAGETMAEGWSVAGGLGDVGLGVLAVRRLFFAIADVMRVLLEVCVPASRALTAIQ